MSTINGTRGFGSFHGTPSVDTVVPREVILAESETVVSTEAPKVSPGFDEQQTVVELPKTPEISAGEKLRRKADIALAELELQLAGKTDADRAEEKARYDDGGEMRQDDSDVLKWKILGYREKLAKDPEFWEEKAKANKAEDVKRKADQEKFRVEQEKRERDLLANEEKRARLGNHDGEAQVLDFKEMNFFENAKNLTDVLKAINFLVKRQKIPNLDYAGLILQALHDGDELFTEIPEEAHIRETLVEMRKVGSLRLEDFLPKAQGKGKELKGDIKRGEEGYAVKGQLAPEQIREIRRKGGKTFVGRIKNFFGGLF